LRRDFAPGDNKRRYAVVVARGTRSMSDPFEYEEEDAVLELAPWVSWPQCPICAQRRQARCPTCGFAQDNFPLADYQELGAESHSLFHAGNSVCADAEEAVLLLCPHCEEAFRPRFYDRCAACGYEFGEGLEVDFSDYDDFSVRAAWAIAGLLAVFLCIFVYFTVALRP
jgi:hypothetical protein